MEEQSIEKLIEENKLKQTTKYIEFPYLEELDDKQYNELKNGNWVVSDPGRRCISYMKNKDGITYRYTNRMHMNKTKRLKYQKLIKNYKFVMLKILSRVSHNFTNFITIFFNSYLGSNSDKSIPFILSLVDSKSIGGRLFFLWFISLDC